MYTMYTSGCINIIRQDYIILLLLSYLLLTLFKLYYPLKPLCSILRVCVRERRVALIIALKINLQAPNPLLMPCLWLLLENK